MKFQLCEKYTLWIHPVRPMDWIELRCVSTDPNIPPITVYVWNTGMIDVELPKGRFSHTQYLTINQIVQLLMDVATDVMPSYADDHARRMNCDAATIVSAMEYVKSLKCGCMNYAG